MSKYGNWGNQPLSSLPDHVRYMRGQCHALAMTLHKKYGLPLVVDDKNFPDHVAVLLNNNTVLDIDGIADIEEGSGWGDWHEVTAERLEEYTVSGGLYPLVLDKHTEQVADNLYKEYKRFMDER